MNIFYPRLHKGNGHVYDIFKLGPQRYNEISDVRRESEQLQLDIQDAEKSGKLLLLGATIFAAGALVFRFQDDFNRMPSAQSLAIVFTMAALGSMIVPVIDAFSLRMRDRSLASKIRSMDPIFHEALCGKVTGLSRRDRRILAYSNAGRALLNLQQ